MGCGVSSDNGRKQRSSDEKFCASSPPPPLTEHDSNRADNETNVVIAPCAKSNETNPSQHGEDLEPPPFDATIEREVSSASPKLKRHSLSGRKHSGTSFTSVAIRGELPSFGSPTTNSVHQRESDNLFEAGSQPGELRSHNNNAVCATRVPRTVSDLDVHKPLQRRVSEIGSNFISGISADSMALSVQRHSSVDLQSSPSAPFNFNDANSAGVVTTSSSFSTRRTNASMASLMPPSVASTQAGDGLGSVGSYQRLPISIPSFTHGPPDK